MSIMLGAALAHLPPPAAPSAWSWFSRSRMACRWASTPVRSSVPRRFLNSSRLPPTKSRMLFLLAMIFFTAAGSAALLKSPPAKTSL
jgi:hypothetical protein